MIKGYSIEEVLPHAHPMILLSRFVETTDRYALCEVDITPDSPFFDAASGTVPGYVGIEYMAQCIASYAGARKLANAQSVAAGYLLGTRKYQPSVAGFVVGSCLQVTAMELFTEDNGLSVFDCTISLAGELLVSAKLTVFQSPQAIQPEVKTV